MDGLKAIVKLLAITTLLLLPMRGVGHVHGHHHDTVKTGDTHWQRDRATGA